MIDPLGVAATLFAVADDRYFPGAAVLLSSLRITGHAHEVIFGDCGLTIDQRARLERDSRIVEIRAAKARDAVLLRPFAHALEIHGVLVFIDSDMIVTGDLTPVFQLAADGKICAFRDPEVHRQFPEWKELFGLNHHLRAQEYISAGFVAWSQEHWPNLLRRWRELCERVPPGAMLTHGASNANPLAQGDQDALNALLMSEVPREAIAFLPDAERPVWRARRVRVVHRRKLACRFDGHIVKLVHADGSRKPWQTRVWWRVRNDAYVRLFRRLAFADDVPVPLDPSEVPVWLRPTGLGTACLWVLDVVNGGTSFVFRRRATRYIAKHVKAARRELRSRRELRRSRG